MASYYGKNIKISIFGESHGPAIGFSMDGLPAGEMIDNEILQKFMDRRAPGSGNLVTERREGDVPKFISGIHRGYTTGAPVTAIIENKNQNSKDYRSMENLPRPGHADFTAQMKYGGFQQKEGGGHFSGRLTAPMCAAGGILMQILERKGIKVQASLYSVGGSREDMMEQVRVAKEQGDSVGAIVQCCITGLDAGVGEPMFDGVEGKIAQAVFAIPAVKGIEFGCGFASADMKGSSNNDAFLLKNGEIVTETNNCGGILGGITTGAPVWFKVAFKPTPSISLPQKTVNMDTGEEEILKIEGRHDPCLAIRAVPVVEAAAAMAIYDLIMDYGMREVRI